MKTRTTIIVIGLLIAGNIFSYGLGRTRPEHHYIPYGYHGMFGDSGLLYDVNSGEVCSAYYHKIPVAGKPATWESDTPKVPFCK